MSVTISFYTITTGKNFSLHEIIMLVYVLKKVFDYSLSGTAIDTDMAVVKAICYTGLSID